MNRKQFIRNLFGATAAVIIGDRLPVPKAIGFDPHSRPGTGGKAFIVKVDDKWMQQREAEFMQKWMHDQEMAMWHGKPQNSEG